MDPCFKPLLDGVLENRSWWEVLDTERLAKHTVVETGVWLHCSTPITEIWKKIVVIKLVSLVTYDWSTQDRFLLDWTLYHVLYIRKNNIIIYRVMFSNDGIPQFLEAESTFGKDVKQLEDFSDMFHEHKIDVLHDNSLS